MNMPCMQVQIRTCMPIYAHREARLVAWTGVSKHYMFKKFTVKE